MKLDRAKFFDGYRAIYGALTQQQVDGLESLLTAVEADADVADPRWVAYMLATVKHECADTFLPITERGQRSYFDKYEPGTSIGKNLGNTTDGDGFLYRGRGYVQITGRANYDRLGKAAGLAAGENLLADPELALRPDVAYRIMSYGMRKGAFTGKKLVDYISEGGCDYLNARRIINRLDQAEKIQGYAVALEKVLKDSLAP